MIKSVIIKNSLSANKIILNLKDKGFLRDIEVIELNAKSAQKCEEIGTDAFFLEEKSGVKALVDITSKLGWKKFRIFSFNMQDEDNSVRFYACYCEKCFNLFPAYVFGSDFSVKK